MTVVHEVWIMKSFSVKWQERPYRMWQGCFFLHRCALRLGWTASEESRCSGCRQMAAAGWSAAVLFVIGFTWVAGGTHFSSLMSEPLYTSHLLPQLLPHLLPHLLHALSIRLSDLRSSLSLHSHSCFFPLYPFLFWPQTTNISCWRQHGSREGKYRTQQLWIFSKFNKVLFCLKEVFILKNSFAVERLKRDNQLLNSSLILFFP